MKKSAILLSILLAATCSTQAVIKPASLINDGMVLQQQSNVRLWGWAKPNHKVTVKASWKKSASCTSDSNGKWEMRLETPAASFDTYSLTFSDGDKLTIKDVLVGEVWFASGQSNMEMPVGGWASCPTENVTQIVLNSQKYKGKLHMVSIPRSPMRHPADSVKAKWLECTPQNVHNFSAAAYVFASQLVDRLNVPVGIINNAWGGSRVEGWLPENVLIEHGIKIDEEAFKKPGSSTPLVMYNGMVKPLAGYNIKGFIWYQGEANVYQANQYTDLFSTMIKQWREDWGQGELPFIFAEIAPYNYNSGTRSAELREAQYDTQKQVPSAWMICTNDLVKPFEYSNIHPCMKFEVGERFCNVAMSKVYGFPVIRTESPAYQSMEVKDGKALLTFNHVERGFNRNQDIEGFEICGSDKKFYPAEARVEGRTKILVSSPLVKEPTAVRYCFGDFILGNLKNGDGLPVIPFRTDRP